MLTVVIVYLYTSLHPLMWVFFCSKCVKLVTFSILHIYAHIDGMLLRFYFYFFVYNIVQSVKLFRILNNVELNIPFDM